MTEVIIDTDIRSKRRLPTWMKSNDASKNEKFGNFDELCSISGNQTETQGDVSMIESSSSEVDLVLAERKKNSEKKEIFSKKYLKKNTRKRKFFADSKDSMCNCSGTKRKSEGEIVERGKSIDDTQQMKLRSAKNNSVKVSSQVITEDEAELTVEDLISIAEEFLTSDEEKQNEQSTTRKSESDSIPMRSPESSISHGGKLVGEIGEIRSGRVLSKCSKKKPEESVTSSTLNPKIIQSGDAAQDMLELFLGPLLKKAPPKETDSETTRELMASTYYELDSLMRNFVDVEEPAPLMMKKKKSSLKDKVAVFF